MINDIFKVRSCSSCISAALNVYSSNFTKIFKATWFWTLIYSVLIGIFIIAIEHILSINAKITVIGLAATTSILLAIITDARIKGELVSMLNEVPKKKLFIKTISANVLAVIFSLTICIMIVIVDYCSFKIAESFKFSQMTTTITTIITILCVIILSIIFIAPFIHSVTSYLFNTDSSMKSIFGMQYKKGFHKLGFILSVIITTSLLSLVMYIFLCLPAYITNIANNIDNYGVNNGDTSGIPSYFVWLNLFSSILMAFVMQYVSLWTILVYIYTYGSVEAITADNKTHTIEITK